MNEGFGSAERSPHTAANDNEREIIGFDRMKERDLQLVFNQHREEHPEDWTEQKLEVYRKRMSVSSDQQLENRFNQSTARDWYVDPRYFYIILERLKAPYEDQE